MKLLVKLFRRKTQTPPEELAKPYCARAKQAILLDELPKAVAYLGCGIEVAPDRLDLYLQRAQIFQYGMSDYSRALEDYRFILRRLEDQPNQLLAAKCKNAIKDMMTDPAELIASTS